MSLNSPSFIANGTILPSRFVRLDSVAPKDHAVIQSVAGSLSIGVSQEGTRDAGGVAGAGTDAASANETIHVYGPGDVCLLEVGAAVAVGARLKSDANGKGIAVAAAGDHYGAIALEAGAADGVKIRVLVQIGQRVEA